MPIDLSVYHLSYLNKRRQTPKGESRRMYGSNFNNFGTYTGGFHANLGGKRYPAEIHGHPAENQRRPKTTPTPATPAAPAAPVTPAEGPTSAEPNSFTGLKIAKRHYIPSGKSERPRVPDRVEVEVTEIPAVQERAWPTTDKVFGILLEDPKPEPVQERTWPTTQEVFGSLIQDPLPEPAGERTWPTTHELIRASDDEIRYRKMAEFAARRDALTKRSHDLRDEVRKIAEAKASQ